MNVFQHGFQGDRPGIGSGAGGFDKSLLLKEYAARFGVRTLVETGLYQGRGSGMDVQVDRYVAIDWQQSNCELALEIAPQGIYHCGDSAEIIATLLDNPGFSGQALPFMFWLDAHALDEDEGAPTVCPLLGELDAIVRWQYAQSSVVLIDDLWAMGQLRGWPTLDELRERVEGCWWWDRDEQDGVMRLTPKP